MSKLGKYTFRDIYLYPYALCLSILVKINYVKRMRGELPDEWYWADKLMTSYGYYVDW